TSCAEAMIAARIRSILARNGSSDSVGNLGGVRCPVTPTRNRIGGSSGRTAALTALSQQLLLSSEHSSGTRRSWTEKNCVRQGKEQTWNMNNAAGDAVVAKAALFC